MLKKLLTSTAILLLGMAGIAQANLVSIDFNDLTAGDVLTDQFAPLGVTFSLLDTPSGYVDGPVAATIPSGTYTPADVIALYPGDSIRDPFYDIEISFSASIDYFSILSLDSDEPVAAIGYLGPNLVESINFGPGSDTQVYNLELGTVGGSNLFDRVVIDLTPGLANTLQGGPEFYDNLVFNTTPVPEPTTMLLFGFGVASLFYSRRKK